MDALSEVLKTVHLENINCRRFELSAPWGVGFSSFDGVAFFAMIRGSCWLEVEGLPALLPLVGGDLVVLPKGQKHALRDEPASSLVEFGSSRGISQECLHLGSGGLTTSVVHGWFRLEQVAAEPLLTALPRLIVVRGEDKRAVEWLETTMQFIAYETAFVRPGRDTVISYLAGILFVQAVRFYTMSQEFGGRCWLRALTHPDIGVALGLIHQSPDQPWTVALLAERVGMSRSAFAAEFRQLVGEPPLQYLTRWRMHKAASLLRLGQASLAQIAHLVGYESEAAFSKAFKRWMNHSPGSYRQTIHTNASNGLPGETISLRHFCTLDNFS